MGVYSFIRVTNCYVERKVVVPRHILENQMEIDVLDCDQLLSLRTIAEQIVSICAADLVCC